MLSFQQENCWSSSQEKKNKNTKQEITGPPKGARMATIIDFAQMREVLGSRSDRSRCTEGDPPKGEVLLFTGVRYERCESAFGSDADSEKTDIPPKPRRKTKT